MSETRRMIQQHLILFLTLLAGVVAELALLLRGVVI